MGAVRMRVQLTSFEAESYVFVVDVFKGLVHPKMKIMSLITHPDVVPNP